LIWLLRPLFAVCNEWQIVMANDSNDEQGVIANEQQKQAEPHRE
jgi:hypothetical protein